MAAKIDNYGKRFIGKELKEKLDARIEEILKKGNKGNDDKKEIKK